MRLYRSAAFQRRYLIVLVLGIACAAVVFLGIYRPLVAWRARHLEVAALRQQQTGLQRQIDDMALLEALNDTLSTELETLGEELRSFTNQEVYIRDLLRILQTNQVNLKNMDPEVGEEVSRIRFEVMGSFDHIVDAAYALEIHPMPTRIETVQMRKAKGLLEARFEILLWLPGDEEG